MRPKGVENPGSGRGWVKGKLKKSINNRWASSPKTSMTSLRVNEPFCSARSCNSSRCLKKCPFATSELLPVQPLIASLAKYLVTERNPKRMKRNFLPNSSSPLRLDLCHWQNFALAFARAPFPFRAASVSQDLRRKNVSWQVQAFCLSSTKKEEQRFRELINDELHKMSFIKR